MFRRWSDEATLRTERTEVRTYIWPDGSAVLNLMRDGKCVGFWSCVSEADHDQREAERADEDGDSEGDED